MRLLLSRIAFRRRRARLERELSEELEFHSALKRKENLAAGYGERTASELASIQMGNVTLAKEESRDMWSFLTFERLWQDVRFSIRTMGKARGFAWRGSTEAACEPTLRCFPRGPGAVPRPRAHGRRSHRHPDRRRAARTDPVPAA